MKSKQLLITFPPSQNLIVKSLEEKKLSYDKEPLTFVYVGRDFFRKGGRETVQVLSKLKKNYEFKLILISDLRIDETKYLRSNYDKEDTVKLIQNNRSWIEYYEFLPNEVVLEKIKSAHVALLPTWMDTYGYSILECQACGTPVISTSLRALTETNTPSVGWLVNVPVNKLNNPIHNTPKEQNEFSDQLLEELKKQIEHVLNHREEIKIKAENCLKQISENYSPQIYNQKLKLVYENRISELI